MSDGNPDVDLCDLRKRIGQDRRHEEQTTQVNLLGIREEVAQGIVDGMRALMDDEKTMHLFWQRGYTELASHSSAGASQWFGKRALTAAVLVIVAWGVGWLIRNGAIK